VIWMLRIRTHNNEFNSYISQFSPILRSLFV
jgi:hypothetical protein